MKIGRDMDASLRQVFGMDLKTLESQWLRQLHGRRLRKHAGVFDDFKVLFAEDKLPDEEKALEDIPEKRARRFTSLGKLLKDRGYQRAARKEFLKAQSLIGDGNLMLQNYLAEQSLALEDYAAAQKELEKVSRLYPNYVGTFIRLARARLGLGRYEEAHEALLEAVGLNVMDPRIHALLVQVYRALEQPTLEAKARDNLAKLSGS